MEYQKIINSLDNTPNQPSKFRTKNRVEINGGGRGTHNSNSQIKFKTSRLKSFNVFKVMQISLLKELYQLHHKQEQTQIMTIKK